VPSIAVIVTATLLSDPFIFLGESFLF
jgi:hypothetical protein